MRVTDRFWALKISFSMPDTTTCRVLAAAALRAGRHCIDDMISRTRIWLARDFVAYESRD